MKRLWLAVYGLAITCAWGAGAGAANVTPLSTAPAISVSISPSSTTRIDQGQTVNFTATIANDSNNKGVSWSCAGSGLTGSACGTFSSVTTTSSTYHAPTTDSAELSITVTATSIADPTKSRSAVVQVFPAPIITSSLLLTVTPNVSYSATLHATGGAGTLTWSVVSGTLPAGLSLTTAGVISGVPTVSGTSTFTVRVTDSSAAAGGPGTISAQFHLTVVNLLSILTTSLPTGSVHGLYNIQINAAGGTLPYAWSLTAGLLPAGLTLQAGSGIISGTPTLQGSSAFTITVKDSSPARQLQSQSLTIVINPPLSITTTGLTNATPNAGYSATLQGVGGVGTLAWTVASGTLPSGLSLSSAGVISGIPAIAGISTFTVKASDASATPAVAYQQLSLTVVTKVSISTTTLPAGTRGVAYSAGISASGGTSPYSWSVATGSLPAGLNLQSSSGVILGVPTSPGSSTFTVAAKDSSPTAQTQTKSLTIAIIAPSPVVITTTTLTNATPNASYGATLAATGGVGPLTWTLVSGALPLGLSLSPSGAISGTPTVPGTSTFTVQAIDSSAAPTAADTAQAQLSLTVVTAMTISTASLSAGSAASAYRDQVVATGGTLPYTWSLTAGSLPSGLTLYASSGAISGTPTSQGSSTFTVAAKDSSPVRQTQTRSLTIVINAALAIATAALTKATPNANYSATLSATGGVGTLTWALFSGALPSGMSLSSSGVISGVSAVSGTATFIVQVADSSAMCTSVRKTFSLTTVTPMSISTTSLSAGLVGLAYNAAIRASGGTPPYTWSVTAGTLPPGLSLAASSGLISGAPTSPGSSTFTVAAQDSSPTRQTQTEPLTLTVNSPPPLVITTASLTNATPNASYSTTLYATGGIGVHTWTLVSGALPAGLSLARSGVISGTPTVSGASMFTVKTSDSSAVPVSTYKQLSLTVVTPVNISTTALASGLVGLAYHAGGTATGGTFPYTWSVAAGALPPGLTLQASSGVISGVPTSSGSDTFTLSAEDSSPTRQTQTQTVTIAINAPPPLAITTTTLISATPSISYSSNLTATGGVGALRWCLLTGALPTGLKLSTSGVIGGIPTIPGISTFTVQVADSSAAPVAANTAQAQLTLTVFTGMSITTTTLSAGSVGSAYVDQVDANGGTHPYTWTVAAGTLPSGLTIQASSGVISGTPTSSGSNTFAVAAQDSCPTPQTRTKSLTIVITPLAPLAITTTALTNATPNTNYTAALHTSGGVGAITWTLISGALPTGLSLSSFGVIAGDPTAPGTSTFRVQAADSSTATGGPDIAQARLSLTVVTLMSITTVSLSAGSVGNTYLDQVGATGGTLPYAWSVTAGSLPPGLTVQPGSGVISGRPTSQGSFTFTLAAQDSSPTPQIQALSISIAIGAPGPLLIATSSLLDATVNQQYIARVSAMGGIPPYTWNISAGALPPGVTLGATTGMISGAPASTGTAHFTIMVTDSSPMPLTQTQPLRIPVDNSPEPCQSSGNEAALSGPYAFSLSGFTDVGFLTIVGSFTADGTGKITGGEADTNGILGVQQGRLVAGTSSYSAGADGRGCATLATQFGVFVTRFALEQSSSNPAAAGRMIAWNAPSASAYVATGQLLRQNSSAFAGGPAGNYVFRTVGWDRSILGRDACVGVLSASNGIFNALEQDCNDARTMVNNGAPEVAGWYTNFDVNGRGTGILAVGQANANLTIYMVSRSQLLVVNADPDPAFSGEWDQQTIPAGASQFTQASLKGNFVFYLNGLSLSGTAAAVSMSTAIANGQGSVQMSFYGDRAGVMLASGSYTCNYTVEANGRVTLSSPTQSCGGAPPLFYLSGLNKGFIVSPSLGVDSGTFEAQSGAPFNNASVAGQFFGGMLEEVIHSSQAEVDDITLDGSGHIAGATDSSSSNAQDAGQSFLAATYAVNPDGSFVTSSSSGAVAGIVISSSKLVMFSPSTLATSIPTLVVMQK